MADESAITRIERLTAVPIQPKYHFYTYKMILIIEGGLHIAFANRSYSAGPGSLICFSNFEVHSMRIMSQRYDRYLLLMEPDKCNLILKDPKLLTIFRNPITFNNIFDVSDNPEIPRYFEMMLNERKTADQYSNKFLDSLLYQLVVTIYREYSPRFPNVNEKIAIVVYEAQMYIDLHFTEELRIADIAKELYISASYLTHRFKAITGYTPMEYLKLKRLSYAHDLLMHSEITVTDTAYKSGFPDVNNFIKMFKKQYSVTPKQIRK